MSPRNVLILCFRTVNVSVPKKTRNNGTLYAYIFLHHAGILPWHDGKQVHIVSPLTTYMVPKPEEINLLTGESTTQVRGFSICRKTGEKIHIVLLKNQTVSDPQVNTSFIDTCGFSSCSACIFRVIMIFKKWGEGTTKTPLFA